MQKNELDWTIGIVNFNSAIYLKWQLKILFESNNPKNFQLIIVDNSVPHQIAELDCLLKKYNNFNNIQIIYNFPKEESASGQHGEGLNLIKNKTKTKYLLVHDPDFFWVKPDYLNIFQHYLELSKDHVAIGAPYPNKVGIGNPWFPSAYGCAYKTEYIEDIDFSAIVTEEKRKESIRKYPPKKGFEYSFDVGWQFRKKLSSKLFHSFEQREAYELKTLIGIHSFETISREYFYKNSTIGFHLFRGTFSGKVTSDHRDPQKEIDSLWLKTRNDYGSFFYQYLNSNTYSKIIIKKKFLQILMVFAFIINKIFGKTKLLFISLIRRILNYRHKLIHYKRKLIYLLIKIIKKSWIGSKILKFLKIFLNCHR